MAADAFGDRRALAASRERMSRLTLTQFDIPTPMALSRSMCSEIAACSAGGPGSR